MRTVSGRPSPSTSPRREPGLVRPGAARTTASLLQPSSGAGAVGEGTAVGGPDGVRDGGDGESVREGEGVTESRDVVEPAPTGLASLVLQAVSPRRLMTAIAM
jgi:hypothetical protein